MHIFHAIRRALLALILPPDPYDRWLESLEPDMLFAQCTDGTVWVERAVRCLAPLRYTHRTVRRAVAATKYHANERVAQLLGEGLAPYLAEEIAERRLFGTFTDPLCIPVPLHRSRLRERGFNQSERIARAMLQALQDTRIISAPRAIVRSKRTHAQARTDHKSERIMNMENAFSVPDTSIVQGRDIILLDDVITTGSTLHEASRALRNAGARDILCVAVAH